MENFYTYINNEKGQKVSTCTAYSNHSAGLHKPFMRQNIELEVVSDCVDKHFIQYWHHPILKFTVIIIRDQQIPYSIDPFIS